MSAAYFTPHMTSAVHIPLPLRHPLASALWLALTLPMAAQAVLTLALVVPLGPRMYRLFFQPIAGATPLVLLIVSIAVHVAMVGLGLLLFGPEGARTRPFSEAGLELGPVTLNSQTLWVLALSLLQREVCT